jgi:hypothetical protein
MEETRIEPVAPEGDAPVTDGETRPNQVMPKFRNNRELLFYLLLLIRDNRKWWLLPMWLVLALLGVFISLTGNHAMLPAIYALF